MDALEKIEVLKATYGGTELDQILGKLLEGALSQHRLNLERYERDLHEFEQQYEMRSGTFYPRFQRGDLGDSMDFFEWAGLYELWQNLRERIHHLEQAL